MTMRARSGVVASHSVRATGDRGSVLQALRDLSPALLLEEPRAPAALEPSSAFLPARAAGAPLPEPTSTGTIDVRAMAARQRLGMATPTAPGFSLVAPLSPPSASPVATNAARRAPSTLFLQVRAFVLGALCVGALTGSIVRAATSTPTTSQVQVR